MHGHFVTLASFGRFCTLNGFRDINLEQVSIIRGLYSKVHSLYVINSAVFSAY